MPQPVGIFDSGVGGLTVLKELCENFPSENFIYLSDSIHLPYGEKTKEEIKEYAQSAVNYLISQGCEIIIIACNTATSASLSFLQEQYPSLTFLGILPAIRDTLMDPSSTVLGLMTTSTLEGEYLQELLKKQDISAVLSQLLKDYLTLPITKIVLGCTHYAFLEEELHHLYPEATCLTGNQKVIDALKKLRPHQDLSSKGKILFHDTDPLHQNALEERWRGLSQKSS